MEQSMQLLGKLTVEQLLTIINFNNKDILLNIINNSMSRSELCKSYFLSLASATSPLTMDLFSSDELRPSWSYIIMRLDNIDDLSLKTGH